MSVPLHGVHKRSSLLSSVAGLALGAVLACPALAAAPRLVITPTSVQRGHTVRVHGTLLGCSRGDSVTLLSYAFPGTHRFAGVPAVGATVGNAGAYSVRVRIPRSRRPGAYKISGRCGGGNIGVSVTLKVRS